MSSDHDENRLHEHIHELEAERDRLRGEVAELKLSIQARDAIIDGQALEGSGGGVTSSGS